MPSSSRPLAAPTPTGPLTSWHSCLRCPMLDMDPNLLPRLDEIEDDLQARRSRAAHEGWLGEVEGLDLTLTFLRQNANKTKRLTRIAPIPPRHTRCPTCGSAIKLCDQAAEGNRVPQRLPPGGANLQPGQGGPALSGLEHTQRGQARRRWLTGLPHEESGESSQNGGHCPRGLRSWRQGDR